MFALYYLQEYHDYFPLHTYRYHPPLVYPVALTMSQLSPLLASLSQSPTAGILDGLRLLERKTSLVSTLLKASVYSIVLQQEMFDGAADDGGIEGSGAGAGSEGSSER